MEQNITRKFETKKNGKTIESEVRLVATAMDKAAFLAAAEGSRWLQIVGADSVLSVREVSVHWRNWYSNEYRQGDAQMFIEVQTKTGTAVFLSADNDPLGFVAGKQMMVAGIYVSKDWKGRRGQVMPWLRAQANPSGRKSTIPTDSEKAVPGVAMFHIYNAMKA